MPIDFFSKEDVLVVCDAETMHATALQALKAAASKKVPVFYMTFTKPASYVLDQLAKAKLPKDNVLLIDCSGNKEKKAYGNVIAIEDAKELTKMSIAAFEFIDAPNPHKLLLIDAINVLAQYNRLEDVSKMLRNIIQKDDEQQTKMLVFCTDAGNAKLLAQIEPFFDTVIR